MLVALAYFLAYRLRFDALGGVPERYRDLFEATIFPVVAGSLIVFTLFRLYQKWWRYSSWRDIEAVAAAVTVTTLALAAYVAIASPVEDPLRSGDVALTGAQDLLAAVADRMPDAKAYLPLGAEPRRLGRIADSFVVPALERLDPADLRERAGLPARVAA